MPNQSTKSVSMDATFSPCGKFRYSLTRERAEGSGTCLFIMLNPSTADDRRDDPTIRRCVSFAWAWGYRRLEVVNLFALRATDPEALYASADPVGPDNDLHISAALRGSDFVIAAWGEHGAIHARSASVMRMADRIGTRLWTLGRNRSGEPRHPLYIPSKTEPEELIVTASMLG